MVLRLVAVDGGDGGMTASSVENKTEDGRCPEEAWPTPFGYPLPCSLRTGVLGDADVATLPDGSV